MRVALHLLCPYRRVYVFDLWLFLAMFCVGLWMISNSLFRTLPIAIDAYLNTAVWPFGCSALSQLELPLPIPRNSVESDHGCTSRIYFDNAGGNMTLTLYNVTLVSWKSC